MSAPRWFRKKPVEIEAMQWVPSDETSAAIRDWAEPAVAIVDTDHIQHLWDYNGGCYVMPSGKTVFAPFGQRCLIVLTLEGEMVAVPGDWIIRGVQGEFYPCKPDIFEQTYDEQHLAAAAPSPTPEEPRSLFSPRIHALTAAILASPRALDEGRVEYAPTLGLDPTVRVELSAVLDHEQLRDIERAT